MPIQRAVLIAAFFATAFFTTAFTPTAAAWAQLAPDDPRWVPLVSGQSIDIGVMPPEVGRVLADADGVVARRLHVYGNGVLSVDRPAEPDLLGPPTPLAAPGGRVIAALWHAFDRPCAVLDDHGLIHYAFEGKALVVEWYGMTTNGRACRQWAPTSRFSVRMEWVPGDAQLDQPALLRLTYRYPGLAVEGVVRAGVRLPAAAVELLPDPPNGPAVVDRARYLQLWGSDGDRGAADGIHGFDEVGAWTIEIELGGGLVGDPDGDGLRGVDNCPFTPNPDQANTPIAGRVEADAQGDACDEDHDDDRVRNENDNCPLVPNRDQGNRDGIGPGDLCDPKDDDADDDGRVDAEDNCRWHYNPLQRDLDGDGTGDACDLDPDGDHIADDLRDEPEVDNCPWLYNPLQKDADHDGLGNRCDARPENRMIGGVLPLEMDADGDEWPDAVDNCPTAWNADQADEDRDGLGDLCDPDRDGDATLDFLQ